MRRQSIWLLAAVGFAWTASRADQGPRRLFFGDQVQWPLVQEAVRQLPVPMQLRSRVSQDPVHTVAALAELDRLLGKGPWDLIYVNYGLGDLFYRDPSGEEIRVMSQYAGGVRVTPAATYQASLKWGEAPSLSAYLAGHVGRVLFRP